MDNNTIARELTGYAKKLEQDATNLYRVKAYRRAADTIRSLTIPVEQLIAEKGAKGLEKLPGIGETLSFTIERLVKTGDFYSLAEEAGEVAPEEHVRNLAGVGPHLAQRLWEELKIQSIDELEKAVADGRIDRLQLTERRKEKLRQAIEEHRAEQQAMQARTLEPGVAALLAVDEQYRSQAERDRLPTIAPHKNNPGKEQWLPILSVQSGGWRFRALFSNTTHAHRLGRTRDWVVIYFRKNNYEGQRTVVTEQRGDLRGRRVVRGREAECREYYE